MKAMGGCARRGKGKVLYVLPLSRAVSPTFDFMMRTSRRATTPHLSVTVVALATLAWVVLLLSSTAHPLGALVSNVGLSRPLSPPGWRRSAAPGSLGAMRRFWFLMALQRAPGACGQAVWTWYESILGREVPFPSPADIGYLGMPVLATAACCHCPWPHRHWPGARGRSWTVSRSPPRCSSAAGSWSSARVPRRQRGRLARRRRSRWPTRWRHRDHHDRRLHGAAVRSTTALPSRCSLPLVGLGLVAFSGRGLRLRYLTTVGAYSSGNRIDIGWFIGFALILVAAVRPSRQVDVDEARGRGGRAAGRAPAGHPAPHAAVIRRPADDRGGAILRPDRRRHVRVLDAQPDHGAPRRSPGAHPDGEPLPAHQDPRAAGRARTASSRERARFAALVQHSSDVVTVVDADARIPTRATPADRVLGLPAESARRSPLVTS